MTVLSKQAREAIRVIHALRKSPAPPDLQAKAEASVMKKLIMPDVIAVSTYLFEEEEERKRPQTTSAPQTGRDRG